jgi:DNA-binding response OmpR family regulator
VQGYVDSGVVGGSFMVNDAFSARIPVVSVQREQGTPVKVLVYSDDRNIRARVTMALGIRPDETLPPLDFVECATQPAALVQLDTGLIDLAILDGEAVPSGGIGLCRQLKAEVFQAPPVLVLMGRPQDAWLATWAGADAVIAHPVNPFELTETTVALLHSRLASNQATAGTDLSLA